MKSDPHAPASDPFHVKNLKRAESGDFSGRHADRFVELVKLHVTGHEEDANRVPNLEELERRQTLVDEFREQLATEGPDAEPPTLVDATGQAYEWLEGDRVDVDSADDDGQPDGTTASRWVEAEGPTADPASVPPRNGPGSDTDTWRRFAAKETDTQASQWAIMNRSEIIAALERDGVIAREQA